MKTIKQLVLAISLCVLAVACGAENGVGTGVANPPSGSTTKAAAAVAAVFSSSDSNASVAAAMLVRELRRTSPANQTGPDGQPCAENDPACTCSDFDQGPSEVDVLQYGSSGTFGSNDFALAVTEADYCELSDGTDNTGSGPDGDGLVNAFTITQSVPVICDGDDTEMGMGAGSTGIYRNTTAAQTGTAYWPQIYGAFVFNVDDAEVLVDCTIFLGEDENILFSDCSDENGETIALDSDVSCSVQSSEN